MFSFHFISLFPRIISTWLEESIPKRAKGKGLFSYHIHQLRDFATDKHRTVDDAPYGGGGGMILKVEPFVRALEHIWSYVKKEESHVIYFSPKGKQFNYNMLESIKKGEYGKIFLLVCGHYEGVDERFIEHWVDSEISIGDFVLTGGELAAVIFADSIIRTIDGALGHENATLSESFSLQHEGIRLLEYPHYTRPNVFRNYSVPEILLTGNHEEIQKWRIKKALEKTMKMRPDLIRRDF